MNCQGVIKVSDLKIPVAFKLYDFVVEAKLEEEDTFFGYSSLDAFKEAINDNSDLLLKVLSSQGLYASIDMELGGNIDALLRTSTKIRKQARNLTYTTDTSRTVELVLIEHLLKSDDATIEPIDKFDSIDQILRYITEATY